MTTLFFIIFKNILNFEMLAILILALVSYIIGSFPTGLIIGKIFFGIDIRKYGSGNIGSTNVFRTLGTKWGIFVQVVDVFKGFVPVFFLTDVAIRLIEINFLEDIGEELTLKIISGLFAIFGHIWSIFLKFRGGKGINTALGVLLGIMPIEVLLALVVFLLGFLSTGIVSVGSLLASLSLALIVLIRQFIIHQHYDNFQILFALILLLIILVFFTHKDNIKRIFNGTENKFEKLHIIKFKRK